jgi:thiol-disulfide isomerase/thioredoxin
MLLVNESSPSPLGAISPRRRRFLAAGVAVGGMAVGASVAWWRRRAVDETAQPALDATFWSQTWPSPQGANVALQAMRGQPLLLNFWATWCPPCVEELPLIEAFYRQHQAAGWRVVGLAVDQTPAVQAFLKKMPLSFPIAMVGAGGLGLTRSLGNVAGSLPFSVVIGADGRVIQRKMGLLKQSDLDAWLALK